MVVGGFRRHHRRRPRGHLVGDCTEGATAIDRADFAGHLRRITDATRTLADAISDATQALRAAEIEAAQANAVNPDDEADTAAYLETRDPFTQACRTSTDAERNCGEPCPCGEC